MNIREITNHLERVGDRLASLVGQEAALRVEIDELKRQAVFLENLLADAEAHPYDPVQQLLDTVPAGSIDEWRPE